MNVKDAVAWAKEKGLKDKFVTNIIEQHEMGRELTPRQIVYFIECVERYQEACKYFEENEGKLGEEERKLRNNLETWGYLNKTEFTHLKMLRQT